MLFRRGDEVTMRDVDRLDHDQLAAGLMEGAVGVWVVEAAMRLIIRHGALLKNQRFLDFVIVDPDGTAAIDFDAAVAAFEAGALPLEYDEDRNILYIAASLVGRVAIRLKEFIDSNDPTAIKHIAEAMMYADGYLNGVAEPGAGVV
ncbi:hypothetical protein [Dactylosporangium sp. NPDC051541]|uniref:hypothetical protein n=1 Tax=Dactylosporangium sp. NPDC051541 TaxID=3363977 RepID=UPI0037A652D7